VVSDVDEENSQLRKENARLQVNVLVLQGAPQTHHYESFTVFLPVLGRSYFFISAKNFCEIRCIGEV
jgi:hypothetical protein